MNTLVNNVLELVRIQYEIDTLRTYLINCRIDAIDFDAKLLRLKNLKSTMLEKL